MCEVLDRIELRGIEQGMQRGIEQGMQRGIEQGMQRGIEQGMQRGIEQGIVKGIEEGKREVILSLVRKGKTVAEISDLTDISTDIISQWIGEAK